MNSPQQRFCPLCDQSFDDGEAVLRCEGCGVFYHPACWVKNDGCSTAGEHRRAPLAQAYSSVHIADGPGEGTRFSAAAMRPQRQMAPPPNYPADSTPEPESVIGERLIVDSAVEEAPRWARPGSVAPAGDEGPGLRHTTKRAARPGEDEPPPPRHRTAPVQDYIIGAAEPDPDLPERRRAPAPYVANDPERPPRRPRVDTEHGGRKAMPKVYTGNAILRYWYIPVAIVIAVLVAGGVIFAAENYLGEDDGDSAAAPLATPTPSNTPEGTGTAGTGTPAGSASTPSGTPSGTPSATPSGAAGKFVAGDQAVVSGTGECLNVRTAAGRSNDTVACVPDDTAVVIEGGPERADSLTWWQVSTPQGDGWAAEEYLEKR